MAALLENLRWRPENPQVTTAVEDQNTEGKFGIPRFDGNPNALQEYEWRVRTKMAKEAEMSKEEVAKMGPLGLRLVEGLRGPALRLAQQVDISVLSSTAGPTTLLKTLNSNLKPRKEQQARELYSAGSKEGGMLARQHGEPMSSYVARRTAWWHALQSLDDELKVPDVLLAEMTLANSGLTEDQRLMIRTVLQGRVTTDTVATELLSQHPGIHEREKRSGGGKMKGSSKGWRFQPRHKGGHRGFFSEDLAMNEDWEVASQSLTGFSAVLEDDESYVPADGEVFGYVAETQYEDATDEADDESFVVMNFALLCENGLDIHNEEACALAAESLQLEHEAYLLRGHGKGKGHGGFQAQRQFDISGSVSFQERKARLAQLKAKTECRRCGARGHWSGDAACPKGNRKGTSKKSSSASNASTKPSQSHAGKSGGKPPKPRVVYFSHRGDPGTEDGWSYMAVKEDADKLAARGARPKAAAKGVCVPPPTSLTAETLHQSSMASSPMTSAPTFAQTLTGIVAAAAGSRPSAPSSTLDEPVRGRGAVRDANKAHGPKTYTSEADSTGEYNLPNFLQRDPNEHVPSSPIVVTASPTEGPDLTADERDTRLLLEALGSGSTQVVHAALHQLGDLDMEVDGEGIATAIYVPPNVHVINPQQVLPPIEALQERRRDQLNEWLDSHTPDHPHYAEASMERWCEFHAGHPLSNEQDEANFRRWHANMLAGFRPELQPIPLALPEPSPKASAVPPSVPSTEQRQPGGQPGEHGGQPACPHKNITRKGTNQHIELETCKDCGLVLKRATRNASAVAAQNAQRDAQQAACTHPRISWRGSNGHQWRNTCTTCGKVATGYYTHNRPGMPTSSTTSARPDEARPLGNFTIEQVQEIFRTCLIVARVKADEGGCRQMNSAAMHRILDAVSSTMTSDATSAGASSLNPGLDNKDNKQISFGEFRGRTFKDVFENEPSYVQWCQTQGNTNNRKLKEFVTYIQHKTNPHFGYMATSGGGSENDLIAILDSGCNKTCHGERWLRRYMDTVEQHHYPLEPDHGGGFRGIGGAINTKGTRSLDVCFEIADGMAVGEIDSIELEDSDAPLLLSISDQRKLGLVVTLGDHDKVYSTTLKAELIATNINGLLGVRLLPKHLAMMGCIESNHHDIKETITTTPEPLPLPASGPYSEQQLSSLGADLDLDLSVAQGCQNVMQHQQQTHESYVAVEDEIRKTMTKGQRKFLEQSVQEIHAGDVSLWATLKGQKTRTPLPRGCKVFLMEIFAGAAVLSSMAMSMGLPIAAPVDIQLDGTDLLDPKVRREIEAHIEDQDPYCVTFAPVCGPWGSWSKFNMARSEVTKEAILQQRDAWYPCLKWIERMVRKRMARGRKFIVENPWPSDLWNTLCMDKLVMEGPCDAESHEPLELVRGDQCEFGL
eukprot:s298_g7.t1